MSDGQPPETQLADDDSPRPRLTTRWFYWWADHTWVQLSVFVVLSTLALIGYFRPSLIRDLFLAPDQQQEHRYYIDAGGRSRLNVTLASNATQSIPARPRPYVEPFRVSGGDCVLVATIPDDNELGFFNKENLQAIYSVADRLQELPQVHRVMWLDNIPGFNLFGLTGTLVPSPNASPRQLAEARKQVLDNPLAVGQLISADGKTLLMHVTIDWFFVDSDDAVTVALRQCAEQATAEVPGANIRYQVTGQVPLHLMVASNHVTDSVKYQLIGYSIMMVSAIVLFRGFAAVIIVALAPAVGVFWTMGMLHFFDLQDNPFNDIIVPVLISLVGLTDSVHLMVEIRHQRSTGLPTRQAARVGIARVGMACFLTSATTAIGFISLWWAHHVIVRDFGMCCVVGVVMTFVSVLTVTPLGCRSPLGRRLHIGMGKSLIDGQLRRIGPLVQWILRHDRKVSLAAILSTIVLVVIALQLTPDEKRYSGLSESGEAAIALRHLDRSLGGLDFGTVNVSWNKRSTEADVLQVLDRVGKILKDEPLIGNPLGMRQILDALPGSGDAAERMSLLDLLPPSLKRAFYDPEGRHAVVQFRIQDLGIAAYSDTFSRIEKELERVTNDYPGFGIALDGNAVWRWRNVFQIVTDLATSLGTASIVIWLVLTLVYRSLRIGLISIIPNVFPLAATGAMLVLTGQHLEMVTVCVFTICIGIAVDDTIHFLTRYQEEMRKGGDHQEVIRRAFTGVGSALLMTTIVLVAGMGSAIVGDSRDARLFGIMGCLTLTTALFADVILLPAMLSRFAKKNTAEST
ncbi:efflux RND transporter permease subunit [Stieleria varia]|uniref:Multidrug efflux system subunit MdtC n=1 Tax=Stieleria varia TaxID=2528005 RepID=A0A5C6AG75_9BACT|nr:efflux RND transporter permease subunit [Stieleria varia]TWT98599.1 multidrug efflux system subunit MdtC [Stieleria varia]